MLRIMLVDDAPERAFYLHRVLERLGYDVVAEISDPRKLHDEVLRLSPDAIIVDTESPSRDTLEHLCFVTKNHPRPIVMFSHDADRESIREAVRAGVTAYIVDGLSPERITPIIETALARFEAFQTVKHELEQTRSKLSERKLIERAKGILMKEKRLSEEEAYQLLRKLAMDKSQPIAAVAEQVITVAKLLG
ncbi:MAG: ANTAR domain-containing protein [Betaproteobacteria bacterium]|nr:ANTAR domain-containing protein [Betaproteobacteria bacterium]